MSASTSNSVSSSPSPSVQAGGGETRIVLNNFDDFLTSNGLTLTLDLKDVVHFCINAGNVCPVDQQHSITVKSLNTTNNSAVISVTLTIASTPTDYTIYLNQPLSIDVDRDGCADIRVTLKSLTATHAVINIVSLASTDHLLGMLGVGA